MSINKYLFTFLILIFSFNLSRAQLGFVTTPGGASSNTGLGPTTKFNFQRYVGVYPESEFQKLLSNGDTIKSLRFNISQAVSIPVKGNFEIYLQNTTDAAYMNDTLWSTITSNMTLVYNDTFTIPNANGFYEIDLNDVFEYTGSGIYLAYQWITNSPRSNNEPSYVSNASFSPASINFTSNVSVNSSFAQAGSFRPQISLGYEIPNNDQAVFNFNISKNACLDSILNYSFLLYNRGFTILDTLRYSIRILSDTQTTIVNKIQYVNLSTNDSIAVSGSINSNLNGNFNYDIILNNPLDQNAFNDTSESILYSKINPIDSFPYFEDFENSENGWWSNSSSGFSDWQLGMPNGVYLNSVVSGSKAWVTNLSGNYANNAEAWVNSPCFNFSNLNNPYLTVKNKWKLESFWDAVYIEYSTNNSNNWKKLGSFNSGINWYNDTSYFSNAFQSGWSGTSNNWVQSEIPLSGLAGSSVVQFRMVLESDANSNFEGFQFDDFTIDERCPREFINIPEIKGISNNWVGPSSSTKFQRSISLYTKEDLEKKILANSQVCSISFEYDDLVEEEISGDIKIYLLNTSDSIFQLSNQWSTAITGINTYYNGGVSIDTIAQKVEILLDSSFTFSGNGFYLAFEWEGQSLSVNEIDYSMNDELKGGCLRNFSSSFFLESLSDSLNTRPILKLGIVPKSNDLSIKLLSPIQSKCTFPANNRMNFEIKNVGINTSGSDHFLIYELIHPQGIEYDSLLIDSLDVGAVSFKNLNLDFSTNGKYQLKVYLSQDDNTLNDTLELIQFANLFELSSCEIPYYQDFELNNGNWIAVGKNSSWQYGQPNGTIINQAHSDTFAWVTQLNGTYPNDEFSYLYSPCFDFTTTSVNLEFSSFIWRDIETDRDGVILESSSDSGNTWQIVGNKISGVNWYNSSNSNELLTPFVEAWTGDGNNGSTKWINAKFPVDGLSGLSNVAFRYVFKSDRTINHEGFAIDDIVIDSLGTQNQPQANFNFNIDSLKVNFYNLSGCGIQSLKWDFGDGNISFLENPIHEYQNYGNYNVCLVAENNFSVDTVCKTISISNLENYDNPIEFITLFPNPTSNQVFILNSIADLKNIRFQLFNLYGAKVLDEKIKGRKSEIDLTKVSNGIYFFILSSENQSKTGKLIINK